MSDRIDSRLARRVRLVCFDVDGVLTDGGIYVGGTEDGRAAELKRFHVPDGLGIKLLVWAGLEVALVSGRESAATRLRAVELGVEYFQHEGGVKLPALERLIRRHSVTWDEIAFVSDDLADIPILRRVGFPVAVANAVPEVRAAARWWTTRSGGRGAAREFAEALLRARGEWAQSVDAYCASREADPSDAAVRTTTAEANTSASVSPVDDAG